MTSRAAWFLASLAAAIVLAASGAADCALAARSSARAAGALDDAGYFAVADRLIAQFESRWDEALGRYEPERSGAVLQINANLLLVHATAALRGYQGRARDDRRARLVARFLTGPLAWTEHPLPHAEPWIVGPGWRAAPGLDDQHPVFASAAAEGLAQAYLAREQLGLEPETVAAIRDQIARASAGPDFRWPALRLNQFNWPVAMFGADATVNGAYQPLVEGLQRHLDQFLGGSADASAPSPSLGPGLRFRYLPARAPEHPYNFDSAEYANIVLGFSRWYGAARAAGMPVPARIELLRAWVRRALAGYWTHAGYLNWDTGLSFGRWHQSKKVPLAQAALLGIAATPELQPGPEWGAWAKWMLDRGLTLYADEAERAGEPPPAVAFGLQVVQQARANAYLAASRYAANAMRAVNAGLGGALASEPPALYSFDPDTGRLAVSTPVYNTAIVPINHAAFAYGGLDLARLFDGNQNVAAGIGGVPPAAFGLEVRTRDGRVRLRTQYGRRQARPGLAPLRLTHAPLGVGASADTATEAFAGPFTDLRAGGSVRRGGLHATTGYRFTRGSIEARWTLSGRRQGDQVRIAFPSWGRTARFQAIFDGGRRARIGHRLMALDHVTAIKVTSEHSGYRLIPLVRPRRSAVRLLDTLPTPSAPDPGPTLAVALRGSTARFAVRIVVDSP